ncbi:hypothetical protein BAE44_0011078, partial [Dichanthelium oligosanthes]
LKSPICNQG